ncbi:MAG: carboxypeptidase regulatory-like domain-containing protein [Candidatus Eisenbacteria sp.]|nr:carboxypeptidase regulatory-like domain-containing protein [Candidatus Eisenbacteria bacterium]
MRWIYPTAIGLLLPLSFWLVGCEADVRDRVGPRVPVPNLTGQVVRAGAGADDVEVELRRAGDAAVVDSTETDQQGRFAFFGVAAGDWEIKASREEPGDFDSVSRTFVLADEEVPLELAAIDIHAYGAAPVEPEDQAVLPRPNLFAPMAFRWQLPERELRGVRVRCYDADGGAVWTSLKDIYNEIAWNGIGDEGEYRGELVPAGAYAWRVKVELEDGLEGRLDWREFILQ